ncbi:HesA/MoeB/ThiF family protein [Fonticella tunisiensis]|uniref:Molybdopterin/thiamine biosynthesis adenylyltransferase n=1 Tax=Fonticella tunisiensis TaxID=1096341 RepID=A0A4R7KBM1_9CLOT|nr:HesA/MoeB/ThiF family protein [Fonticella tunisiensis]TDT52057.1 molybdopterin/thiamine biosynthesis adenylyltransferase [Fonticella tunisiensis]
MERYQRNIGTLTVEENERIKNCRVCVVGCGGIGGYVIEMLGRLGIGYITAVDGDVFDKTNLNRQILSDDESIGKSKAQKAKKRMMLVNPFVTVKAIEEKLTKENAEKIINGNDVVVDALDNLEGRKLLADACEKLSIPLVHGAIEGWYAQVSTIFPGDRTFQRIYGKATSKVNTLGNPSFTPALAASIEVSEVVKLLTGRGTILRNKLLYVNLLDNEYTIIDL